MTETTTTTSDRAAMVAHDTRLAELYGAEAQARRPLESARSMLAWAKRHDQADTTREEAAVEAARLELVAAQVAIRDHEVNYTGWARFYVVTNTNGHIHRSLECSTCYSTTLYRFLPDLSGLEDADAVADQGEILCSVCYPDAPVEWTNGTSKASREERDARAQAKAERAAAKLAKALLPTGEPLEVVVDGRRSTRIETIHTAKAWLTDAMEWNGMKARRGDAERHPSFPADAELVIAEALAARTGETVDQVLEAARKRADRRS